MDIGEKLMKELEAEKKAREEAEKVIKYPLGEFPEYNIVDIVVMLRRHRKRRITDRFIEEIIWGMKS